MAFWFHRPPPIDTLRCGRCSDILPDETMTYCPACGVPFSQVPATTQFVSFREYASTIQRRKSIVRNIVFSFTGVGALIFSFALATEWRRQELVSNANPQLRPIVLHFAEFPHAPQISPVVRRTSIGIAVQSFQDHFGLELTDVRIKENSLPEQLKQIVEEGLNLGVTQGLSLDQLPITQLSFWEKKIFPELTRGWKRDANSSLDVWITNLPVIADADHGTHIETRHLGAHKLISGLGHPALVIVSTARMDGPEAVALGLRSDEEKARFLGEFIIAHELGHALLGLADTVVESDFYRNKKQLVRAPAFIPEHAPDCLMTTDQGGGQLAWSKIRNRPLGQRAQCSLYESTSRAFQLRAQAVKMLTLGHDATARKLHKEAIDELSKSPSGTWLLKTWNSEHAIFYPWLTRWTQPESMVQLNP